MKKLIYCAAALATALFAGSCQQELLDTPAGETTVTYSVELPGEVTKAIGDGTNVDELVYELWIVGEDGEITRESTRLYQKTLVNKQENKWIVTLNLVQDQTYKVLFWAQVEKPEGHENYNTNNLTAVTYAANITKDYSSNQEDYAAFYASKVISTFTTPKRETVTLKRPFAQLNIGTDNDVTDYTVTMNTSKVTVAGVPTVFNVATSVATNLQTITFDTYSVPTEQLTVASRTAPYKYVAMNYVFASETGIVAKVSYDINSTLTAKNLDNTDGATTPATISNVIPNVPLQENYRTNIIGNLLSSKTQYDIVIDANFEPSTKEDMEVINAGLVENINGDYEISNVYGFAYAINNLFADGGTFYIHPGVYDFTGIDVVPQPTEPGAILNVKANEVPVVTRSTPEFVIIGLNTPLVSEVTTGSQALFSGLVLPEDNKLVAVNNGVVGIANCSNAEQETGEALIGNNDNGEVVNTVSMASVDEINAAIAQGLKLIELTADMSLKETLVISKDVTLDGCGHTLTSTAARAINVSGAEADGVTIKNLVINCSGERAINIIQNATDVTIDNVTATAANYTVNVATSAPGAVVNVKNSTLNGLCTVNVSAEAAKVTVDNSTINCNDNNATEGESYSALSLNREAVGGKIIATNTVVNVAEGSDSHKGRNGAENGVVTINDSTEEVVVMVAAIIYPNNNYYHASVSLDGAIDFAQESKGIVTLIRDITVAEPVIIEEGQTVVLDLNGKTLSNPNGYAIENYSELTITGEGNMEGLGGIRSHSGSLTINGGNYTCSSNWSTGTYNHILKAVDTEVVINGGNFDATVGGTNNAMINVSENSIITINGGTFKNVNGVIPQFAPYMFTYEKNGKLIINDGEFYGGWRFNGETATTDIYGGNFTVSYDGQSFHATSTHVLTVYGGTFSLANGGMLNPTDYVAYGYKAVTKDDVTYTIEEMTPVAKVNSVLYESISEAFNAAKSGDTVTFLTDVEQVDGFLITDKNLTIDLNNNTFTVSEGTTTNNRNFKINGSSVVTIKGGIMVAKGQTTSGAYGTVRTEGTAQVTLEDVKLYSYRGYGLNVKAYGGTKVIIKNSEIYAEYGGGVESAGGTIELTDVKIEQKYIYESANWCSSAIGVNGGGQVTVYSGDYTSDCYGLIVMSSGGTANVYGGNISTTTADKRAIDAGVDGQYNPATHSSVLNLYGGNIDDATTSEANDGYITVWDWNTKDQANTIANIYSAAKYGNIENMYSGATVNYFEN